MVAVVAVVAEVALPDKEAVIVPALKLPEASRATIVEPVFPDVALLVTVKVVLPDWLAVKDALPDRPVPDVLSVRVPSPTVGRVDQDGAEVPLDCRY